MSSDHSEPAPLSTLLRRAAARLAEAGVPDPQVDAELLAGHILGGGRGEIQARALRGDVMTPDQVEGFDALLSRRATREPLQHLTGRAPFRHLELRVGP